MDALFAVLLVACFFAILYGLFLTAFKKGRRKLGLKISLGSVFALFLGMLAIGLLLKNSEASEKATTLGFESVAEMQAAEAEGISDPEIWAEFEAAQKRATEQAERERRAAEAQEAQAERRKGFHCLSSWDGSHQAFKRTVRQAMRNPSSFDHIETRITPVDENGQHTLLMKYRAENGFGGMTIGEAVALIDNVTCNAKPLSVE